MVIYTLPGPIYDYSAKLVKFEPDVISLEATFDGKVPAKDKDKTEVSAGTALVKLTVNSPKGLSNLSLAVTPSDSDLGAPTVVPVDPRISFGVVGASLVVQAVHLAPGSTVTITLPFRRRSIGPADLNARASADELESPASVSTLI